MKLKVLNKKRSKLQGLTWLGLPLVAVGGWFYAPLGYLLMGCMVGALGIAAFKGRLWCDWMCPRGAFFDLILKKASSGKRYPALFTSRWTRGLVVAFMMTVLGSQVYIHWGDWEAVGLAFVMLLTVTTLVGIVIGIVYRERTWCMICPMGTFAALMSTGKKPLAISAKACNDCGACAKVCPMQLDPGSFQGLEIVADNDCIKCSTCVAVCPKKALEWKKAA